MTRWPWQHWAQLTPDALALHNGERWLSWQALALRVSRLAAGFHAQGVNASAVVALKSHNSEQAVLSYLALLQCGARLLTLNPHLPSTQTAALLPGLNVDFILVLDGAPEPGAPALTAEPASHTVSAEWQPDRFATLTLTSGSTGLPKAAVHTFRAHLASAVGVAEAMAFTAADRWLLSLPLCHVSGQGILWRCLRQGAGLVLPGDKPLPEALENCTHASLVPTQLWRILQQPGLPAQWRHVLLGGAAIPVSLTAEAEKRGLACWCGYGMTETASTVTLKRANGSAGVGLPLPGHQVRVDNGEIVLHSAALASGYWQQGQFTPLPLREGGFATRDKGGWQQGEWHITGRLDNQFSCAGEGIQPEEIEAVLQQHPAVAQAFILPVPNAEYGHRPVALVAFNHGCSFEALAAWARPQLTGLQQPVAWYPLPAQQGGGIKIARRALHHWLAEQMRTPQRAKSPA